MARGETLDLFHKRVVEKQFPTADEDIEVEIDVACHKAVMEVLWPSSRNPGSVKLLGPRSGDRASLDDLVTVQGDRKVVSKTLYDLKVGDKVTILWKW